MQKSEENVKTKSVKTIVAKMNKYESMAELYLIVYSGQSPSAAASLKKQAPIEPKIFCKIFTRSNDFSVLKLILEIIFLIS